MNNGHVKIDRGKTGRMGELQQLGENYCECGRGHSGANLTKKSNMNLRYFIFRSS